MAGKISEWMAEASRRRVFRTAGVYLVAVWGISSGGVDLASVLGIPESVLRAGIFAAIAFLPVVVLLAWRFDISRTGIVRDPQDLMAEERAEADLASMPTMLGGETGTGGVVVRWEDANGESAFFYVEEFFMGRGVDCRVRFYDPLISRQHARVFSEDGDWYIEDLGSRNGTFVDEAKVARLAITGRHSVRLNDEGPVLEIESVAGGAPALTALSTYPAGQPTAHVRLTTTAGGTARGLVRRHEPRS